MQNNPGLSIATTSFGVIGGVSKAISADLTICAISFQGMVDVAFYAVVSASVGYGIKLGIDALRSRIQSKKRKK